MPPKKQPAQSPPDPAGEPATIDLLLIQGAQARREHRLADAEQCYLHAVSLCRESTNTASLAAALTGLGQIERDLHRYDSALQHYQEAAAVYRTEADALKLAHTVRHIADIYRNQQRPNLAGPAYEEALGIYRSQPSVPPLDLANAIRGSAILQLDSGNLSGAKLLWEEARHLYKAVGVEAGVAECDRCIAAL